MNICRFFFSFILGKWELQLYFDALVLFAFICWSPGKSEYTIIYQLVAGGGVSTTNIVTVYQCVVEMSLIPHPPRTKPQCNVYLMCVCVVGHAAGTDVVAHEIYSENAIRVTRPRSPLTWTATLTPRTALTAETWRWRTSRGSAWSSSRRTQRNPWWVLWSRSQWPRAQSFQRQHIFVVWLGWG